MPQTPSSSESPESIGSYRIKRKLGSGGMGVVFLAHDDRLRRDVAIKRIRAGATLGPEQRERLRREARAAAGLSHPSIVQVYDIIEEPDGDSVVMEYVEGETLWELIKQGGLDGQSAIEVLLQVSDGLEAAHRGGLVHRDLKGENVIVGPDGDAKILDFGVAKSRDPADDDQALTTEGMAIGTFRSMSPEQCEGGEVDARSDLFSFGVLMYEMFAGRTPFAGKTPLHTLSNVFGFDPPPVTELNRSVPKELSELIDTLLSKDPENRPPSAAAVAAILEGIQDATVSGGIVMPRLTMSSDSNEEAASVAAEGTRASPKRRRKTTAATAPNKGMRRFLVPSIGAMLAAAAIAVFALQGDSSSRNRVMVFPLVVSGTGDVRASIGEDVATMIGTALDGTDPLRWIDAWPLLEGEARQDIRVLSASQLSDLATAHGSAFFITGRVIMDPDSARARLELYDALSGARVASNEGVGAAAYPWRAGLSAVNGLLPELIPTAVPDVEESFAARPPGAVAQFLLGEQQFRRADVGSAFEHFQRAFALDTTFGLAAIRGAQAASWDHEPDAARELARSALGLTLPPRAEAFVSGFLAFAEYNAEEAVTQLNQALAEDSTLTVAWAALGEVYRHRAPREPWPAAMRRPFERALELDPDALNVLYHRLEEVIAEGDLETARTLNDRFLLGDADRELQVQTSTMLQCLEGGATSQDWTEPASSSPWTVTVAATQFLIGGRNLPCAEALYRAVIVGDTTFDATATASTEVRYWSGLHGLAASRLAQGQFADAQRLILAASEGFETFQGLIENSSVSDAGIVLPPEDAGDAPLTARPSAVRAQQEIALTRWSELAILVGALYPEMEEMGDLGAADIRALAGPDYTGVPYRTSIWMLGLWEARNGRPAEAARAAGQIRTIAASQDDEFVRAYSMRMAEALDAHRVLAEGDEVRALARFRGLTTNASEGVIFLELIGPLDLERLVLAELEVRLGDPQQALKLVLGFDEPNAVTHALYLPQALKVCEDAARQIQQNATAQTCATRLSALGWPNGSP